MASIWRIIATRNFCRKPYFFLNRKHWAFFCIFLNLKNLNYICQFFASFCIFFNLKNLKYFCLLFCFVLHIFWISKTWNTFACCLLCCCHSPFLLNVIDSQTIKCPAIDVLFWASYSYYFVSMTLQTTLPECFPFLKEKVFGFCDSKYITLHVRVLRWLSKFSQRKGVLWSNNSGILDIVFSFNSL